MLYLYFRNKMPFFSCCCCYYYFFLFLSFLLAETSYAYLSVMKTMVNFFSLYKNYNTKIFSRLQRDVCPKQNQNKTPTSHNKSP